TEIKELHQRLKTTTIYVTHDQIEAMSLADRIVIMHEGFIQQVGTPDEVYSHPANLFVAQFVGSPVMNVAEASVSEKASAASVTVGDAPAGFEFPSALLSKLNGHAANGGLTLGIRPEGVLVRRDAAPGYMPVEAHIIEPLGSFDIVDLKVGSQMLRARTKAGYVAGPGEKVHARIDPEQAHFFDTASGKSLGVRL
ncbi:MAG: ABC transporter ATP-binding protein, partial [Mesorhizobium sp.]